MGKSLNYKSCITIEKSKDKGQMEFFVSHDKGPVPLTSKNAYKSIRKRSAVQKNEQNLG